MGLKSLQRINNMSKFENLGKRKTQKKIEQEQREERIDSTEYMTGLNALHTTTEHLDKMDEIADSMKNRENHDGDYVENEYDLKKQEMQKHVVENLKKKSKFVKGVEIATALAAAGLITNLKMIGLDFEAVADAAIEHPGMMAKAASPEMYAAAGTALSTIVMGGLNIARSIKNSIKKKFETNKAMAKYITGKVEGLEDDDADILAKSKNWFQGKEALLKKTGIENAKDEEGVSSSLHHGDVENAKERTNKVYSKFQK